jgi:hypothetical protein
MANIHKSKVEYDTLSKLSLCFCPYKYEEKYPLINGGIDENYNISAIQDGYYDTKYIHDKTGYWPGELYRIGVVYILKDGSLSPVFNIRGATNIAAKPIISPETPTENLPNYFHYKIDKDLSVIPYNTPETEKLFKKCINDIDYSEQDYIIIGGTA